MPELPDVEVFKRLAEQHCLHHKVARVDVPDAASLKGIAPADLDKQLHGRPLQSCRRHGKVLLLEFPRTLTLAMHFGTNGALRYVARGRPDPAYVRLWLAFTDGDRLGYINPRRIGHVQAVADSDTFIAEAGLGPDALADDFTQAAFSAALAGSRQTIKALLMDQSRMAGIGNIYSDEILLHARLHPSAVAGRLEPPTQRRLFESMRSVLQQAIACGAGAEDFTDRLPAGFLLPERHAGGTCPGCGTRIRSIKSGGRTAYYCPKCQPEP